MLIYGNSNVTVTYDDSVPCVIWTPLQFMKNEEWRIPFLKGLDFVSEKIKTIPEIHWLNDTRKLKMVAIEDLNWLNKNVNDPGFKLGIKKVSFVLPENIFGRMAVKFYVEFTNKRTDNQFQIKAFQNYSDAVTWMKASSNIKVNEAEL